LVQQLEPHDVSWMAVKNSDDFSRLSDYDLTWRDDARRFEFITLPYQDFGGMNASLELMHSLGLREVSMHAIQLANRIVVWACSRDDVELVTPASATRHGAIVLIRPPDGRAASERLTVARIAHSWREGAVRLSPHFYNTMDEVERALQVLAP
jgi:cysteine desulfurase/selenocysteine lyase